VLWLILGSHALFFTAGTAILYSVVLPIVMMRSIDATGVSVLVKRQLVMMGKPDMASVSLTGTGTRSPLRYDATLCLPPYLVKKHERHSHPGLMVFFEATQPGMRTGVLSPPSRLRLRSSEPPTRASSQSS